MWPSRPLTDSERKLAHGIFGDALDLDAVRLNLRRWWLFQPKRTAMAPDGGLWFHPDGDIYCDCFATASISKQGLFLHELVHVWQHQQGIYLPLARHPFCRYDYNLKADKPFERYGIEQQAEIVRHVFLLRLGHQVANAPPLEALEALLPFTKPQL